MPQPIVEVELYRVRYDGDVSNPIVDEEPTKFYFSPISLEMAEAMTEWVRRKYIEAVALVSDALKLKGDEKIAYLTEATPRASTITWDSREGINYLASVDGMAFVFYISLRKMHPDVTLTELHAMFAIVQNMEAAAEVFESAKAKAKAGEEAANVRLKKSRSTSKSQIRAKRKVARVSRAKARPTKRPRKKKT